MKIEGSNKISHINQSQLLTDRWMDTCRAKIKADFLNSSFGNLVREDIPIEVCDKSTVIHINVCAVFQGEKSGMG
jgi:hypothetical protein